MFYLLSKTVGLLSKPVVFILLFLILGIILHKKGVGKVITIIAALLLYSFSTPLFSGLIMTFLEVRESTLVKREGYYDAVVVLTGMVNMSYSTEDYVEFKDGVDRILGGIRMVEQGYAKKLLITGGLGGFSEDGPSEAALLKIFAMKRGVDEERIILEEKARNTYENALYTKDLVESRGYKRILIVTSAYHMKRAQLCFRKQGLEPDIYPVDYHRLKGAARYSPIPDPVIFSGSSYAVNEIVGLIMYRMKGYI